MFYGRFSGIREREPGGVLNILLRACRCARVWFVRKRSGTVKIPAGWSGKYLWKDGILYRMTRKKSGNTPRGREKWIIRKGNSCWKKRIFLLKKFRRSAKNIETGRKISQFRSGKGKKNYSDEAKKSQKTDDPDGKSSRFFVGGRKNTEMHGKRSRKIYRIIRKKHERYTADRNKFYHWRTVGLKKTDFSTGKVKRKKQKNPQSA